MFSAKLIRYGEMAYQYRHVYTNIFTRDAKLRFLRCNGLFKAEISDGFEVLPGHGLSTDEVAMLFDSTGKLTIERSELTSYLRSAKELLATKGYTLDTRYQCYIAWQTTDGVWNLQRNPNSRGWSAHRADSQVAPYARYPGEATRDAAIAAALAIEQQMQPLQYEPGSNYYSPIVL